METHLSIVVRLQQGLDELKANQAQLDGIPEWMQELHARYSERKGEIDALNQTQEEAAAARRAAEAEAADFHEKLKTYQEQIGRVRNQREYSALLQEIDTVKEHIRLAEEQALEALESHDETQGKLDEEQAGFAELDQQYQTELAKWEEQKPEVRRQVESLGDEVAKLEERLPKNVLDLFRRILERHQGNALALVQKVERVGKGPQIYSCGACNYRVRPQSVVEIANNGSLVLCDSCRRILYLE